MSKVKNNIIIKVVIIISLFVLGDLYMLFFPNINKQYKLDGDCVTYFDDGRYQLLKVTENDYYLYDMKERKQLSSPIKYYVTKNEWIYAICCETVGYLKQYQQDPIYETRYLVFNIKSNEKKISTNIDDLNNIEKNVLMNKNNLINLEKKRSSWSKYFNMFIPHKWRKW